MRKKELLNLLEALGQIGLAYDNFWTTEDGIKTENYTIRIPERHGEEREVLIKIRRGNILKPEVRKKRSQESKENEPSNRNTGIDGKTDRGPEEKEYLLVAANV